MRTIADFVGANVLLLNSFDSLCEKFESETRYINCHAAEIIILHQTCDFRRHHAKQDIAETAILFVCTPVDIFRNRSELGVAEMLNYFSESRFRQMFQALCNVLLA